MANTTRKSEAKRWTLVALIIFALVAIIGGTYARYSSSGDANATVKVAKWKVALNGSDISSATATVTPTVNYVANNYVKDGKLAPNRSATFDVELDPTGSEVAIDYVLKINTANITGITNAASKISVSGAKYRIGTVAGDGSNATITGADGVTIEENLEDVLANKKVTVRVTITWDNDSDNENAADTANGVTAADIKVPVTITAKQHIG